jgi:hypothetical protein
VAGLARVPDRVPGGAGQDQPGIPGRGPPGSNDIPWVVFRKGDRKLEVMRPCLDATERAGRSAVVAIGEAREFQ